MSAARFRKPRVVSLWTLIEAVRSRLRVGSYSTSLWSRDRALRPEDSSFNPWERYRALLFGITRRPLTRAPGNSRRLGTSSLPRSLTPWGIPTYRPPGRDRVDFQSTDATSAATETVASPAGSEYRGGGPGAGSSLLRAMIKGLIPLSVGGGAAAHAN